jgi:hypothetical protein
LFLDTLPLNTSNLQIYLDFLAAGLMAALQETVLHPGYYLNIGGRFVRSPGEPY